MSNKRSSKDRVEKRRQSVKDDTIKLNLLKTLEKLNLLGPKLAHSNTASSPFFRMAMLKVTIDLDLSGEEWDDDYNPKNG